MLSEPVEKMANPVATPEAGSPQDIPTHDICPQRTMRVRTRNGSTEPVDVATIVRTVDRCCAGLSDIDPFRIVTKTINGLYDGATAHAPSLIPGGCRLHQREERGGRLGWIISKISETHERPLVASPHSLR
jgi:ribonucleoside-diphosphate reductase alpha chain